MTDEATIRIHDAAGGVIWGPRSTLTVRDMDQNLRQVINTGVETGTDEAAEDLAALLGDPDMSEPVRAVSEPVSELWSTPTQSVESAPDVTKSAPDVHDPVETLPDSAETEQDDEDEQPDGWMRDPGPTSGRRTCRWCGLPGAWVTRKLRPATSGLARKHPVRIQRTLCETCQRRRSSQPQFRLDQEQVNRLDQPLGGSIAPSPQVSSFEPDAWMLDYLAERFPLTCKHCGQRSDQPIRRPPAEPVVASGVVSIPSPQWQTGPPILPRRRDIQVGPRPLVSLPRPPAG